MAVYPISGGIATSSPLTAGGGPIPQNIGLAAISDLRLTLRSLTASLDVLNTPDAVTAAIMARLLVFEVPGQNAPDISALGQVGGPGQFGGIFDSSRLLVDDIVTYGTPYRVRWSPTNFVAVRTNQGGTLVAVLCFPFAPTYSPAGSLVRAHLGWTVDSEDVSSNISKDYPYPSIGPGGIVPKG